MTELRQVDVRSPRGVPYQLLGSDYPPRVNSRARRMGPKATWDAVAS